MTTNVDRGANDFIRVLVISVVVIIALFALSMCGNTPSPA